MLSRWAAVACALGVIVTGTPTVAAQESAQQPSQESAQESAPERASLQPRIYGGTPAPGAPGVVALGLREGGAWSGECSAALWRPRLLITAAHCVTVAGSGATIEGIAVFPPGAPAVLFSNTGPQGASSAQVIGVYRAPDYVEANATVDPNDFAVLVLDRDLGPAGYTRLATGTELRRWAADRALIDHLGYGLTGVDMSTTVPMQVQLAMEAFSASTRLGPAFSTAQSPTAGVCPGDSGSPAVRNEAGMSILLGPMVGGNAPCSGASGFSNVGLAALGYLPVLNAALSSVGSPTIPNGPLTVTATARNRDAVLTWPVPAVSPETVVGYDVTDSRGSVVCTTTSTTCTVPNLPDGEHRFWVRARNIEGEGGSSIDAAIVRIAPPGRIPRPSITRVDGERVIQFTSLAGTSSAVVRRYVVRTTAGKVLCRGPAPDATTTVLRCTTLPKRPGTYRVTVTAVTEMGTTQPSVPSRSFRVR